MKDNKGITLAVLVMYICVMMVVLSIMSLMTAEFYNNTETVNENVQEIIEFNKFNNYFLKEVKTKNNKVAECNNKYILFITGNIFRIDNGIIYFNNTKVCENVRGTNFSFNEEESNIIKVTLTFKNGFSKTIRYVLENMY